MFKQLVLIILLRYIINVNNSLCYSNNPTQILIENCDGITNDDIIAYSQSDIDEGWHIFYVESNHNYTNNIQSYASGYLEGYIYSDLINFHYTNIKNTLYNGKISPSEKANQFIKDQKSFINSLIKSPSNEYEEVLSYLIEQYNGLYQGYKDAYLHHGNTTFELLTENDFWFISYLGDFYDLNQAYPNNINKNTKASEFFKECTGYIRYLPEINDIYIAHNTHNIYSMMNRIYKHYNLTFKLITSDKTLNSMKFTSRPGDLNSKDDFYILSNQMVVLETSLEVYNKTLYSSLSPLTIPKFLRVNIANRLSINNDEWVKNFFLYNSGTHNDQWVIIDYKQLDTEEMEKIIYIAEQTPNISSVHYIDMTEIFKRDLYIGSYNCPYIAETVKELGANEDDYYNAKRFFVIRDLNCTVKDINDVKFLIDYHDRTSLCDQIGSRCDIGTDNPFGAIDAKIINRKLIKQMRAFIRYGPPYMNGVSLPFEFGEKYENFSHIGIPNKFMFNWIEK